MLYEYLTNNYQTNEPIFLSDITLPGITNNYIRQMFKQLCDSGKLMRFNTGIYYLPEQGASTDTSVLSVEVVAMYKYISRRTQVYGYYSGQTLASQLGLAPAPDNSLEIVSNYAGGKYRELLLNGTKIILRKPKFIITKENRILLQFLDLIKDIDLYSDHKDSFCKEILKTFIWQNHITKEHLDSYITEYPDKIYRIIYEMDLYQALQLSIPLNHFKTEKSEIISDNSPLPRRRKELSVELL